MRNHFEKCYFVLFLFVFSISLWSCYEKGVLVIIKNNSGNDIQSLKIYYIGGVIEHNLLGDKQSFSERINPISESNLRVEFLGKDAKPVKKNVDVYIEKNYSGKIEITITEEYDFMISDTVHI